MGLSDCEISAEVIELCRQGDRDALRAVYEAYKDKVYSISLYFFHGDQSMASDITQQVFLKLITGFRHFRGDSAFSTWLYRLVANTCIDAARRGKFRQVPLQGQALDGVSTLASPEHEIESRQVAAQIQMAVSTLPPKFRMAILLRYFDDLSYEEMAMAMNCSKGTVASRLSRGHQILASKLTHCKHWFEKKEA